MENRMQVLLPLGVLKESDRKIGEKEINEFAFKN